MEISRRDVLTAVLASAGLLALSACSAPDETRATGAGTPQPGGTLRIGALGQTSGLEQDPHATIGNDSDFLVLSLVYDALTVPGADPNVAPRLASAWEQLDDLRQWRFTIDPTARFHDDSPVTPDDVVWSLQRLHGIGGETKVPVASPDDIVADGDDGVILTTPSPNRDLPMLLRLMTFTVKKGTESFTEPVGTGPFRLESYQDGNARLVRNEHWHGGKPLLDAIEVTRFESTTAMSNAVVAGQIDLASNIGAVAGRTAESRPELSVVRRANDVVIPIAMRTSDGPFADPQVREALRLATDREALVQQVTSGYGSIANDVLGVGDPTYDTSLEQRTRDLDRAKALLADAGFDTSKTYTLYTKEEAVGEADTAKLFAAQVKDAGVSIEVVVQDVGEFYDNTWLTESLYTASWGTNDSVTFFASKVLYSKTEWNETAFADTEFDDAYREALAAPDNATYEEASRTLQKIQYERGGYLVWGMLDGVDVASTNVHGLPELGGYGRVQLENAWLSS